MSTKTTITIKTDKKLRDAAKQTADKLGIPLTTIMNAQLSQFVSEGRFEVSIAPRSEKVREWELMSEEMDCYPERFKIYNDEDDLFREIQVARTKHPIMISTRALS